MLLLFPTVRCPTSTRCIWSSTPITISIWRFICGLRRSMSSSPRVLLVMVSFQELLHRHLDFLHRSLQSIEAFPVYSVNIISTSLWIPIDTNDWALQHCSQNVNGKIDYYLSMKNIQAITKPYIGQSKSRLLNSKGNKITKTS